jgi:hypothetical protein
MNTSNVIMFEFNVAVKVDFDDLPLGVEISWDDIRELINDAISKNMVGDFRNCKVEVK